MPLTKAPGKKFAPPMKDFTSTLLEKAHEDVLQLNNNYVKASAVEPDPEAELNVIQSVRENDSHDILPTANNTVLSTVTIGPELSYLQNRQTFPFNQLQVHISFQN